MTSDLRDLTLQSLPLHHLGSRVVNKCTVLFKNVSGINGRALNATSPGEAQRHGTLWTIKQWCLPRTLHGVRAMRGILRHTVSGVSDVDLHGTIGGHPEFPGGSVGTRQSLTEGQPGNSVEENTERLRPSTEGYSERRQRCEVLRTMRDVRHGTQRRS